MIGGQGLANANNCRDLFSKNWKVLSVIVAIAIQWGSTRATLRSQGKRLDRIDNRIESIEGRIYDVISDRQHTKAVNVI